MSAGRFARLGRLGRLKAAPTYGLEAALKYFVPVAVVLVLQASAVSAQQRFAVVVSGAAGGEKYAAQQQGWRGDLVTALTGALHFPESNISVLAEDLQPASRSTAENVRRLLGDLRRRVTEDDTVLLVLIGHGTFDGADAKFNLVGPDLTAREWKGLLAALPGRLVLVNTTASSFPFLEELSKQGRVTITATDSTAQRFATVFPEYFAKALGDGAIDYDKNGRISVWEVFAAASAAVKQHYEQRGQLSTERPLLDDDGDRVGREAETPGQDGGVARAIFLDAPPGASTDVAVSELERQRRDVEARIEALKSRKSSMSEAEYAAELERLLVQLARLTRQIRERS